MKLKIACSFLLLFLLAGCHHISDPYGCAVTESIRERAGYDVVWERKQGCGSSDLICSYLLEPLSCLSAVQIALLNSPHIQALFEEVGIAQADLVNASLIANPLYTVQLRIPEGSFPTWNTEMDALQPLISILLQPIRKKTANLSLEQVKANVTDQIFAFIEAVATTYYQTQAALINLSLQEQIVEAEELAYLVSLKQFAVGNINQLELDLQNAMYNEALVLKDQAKIEVNTFKQKLSKLLGVSEFTIDMDPEMLGDLPYTNLDLLCMAYESRFDLYAMRLQTDAIATSLGLYQWYSYTDFAAGIAYERDIDSEKTFGPGFGVAIPIFNFGQGDRMRVRAMLAENVHLTQNLCLQIRQEVETAYLGLQKTKEQFELYRNEIIPAKKNMINQTLRLYNFMNASVYNLLETKINELESHVMLNQIRRDHNIYKAQLIRAVGGGV